jgi:lipoprotein-releasing system ATP-binding protein
MLKISNLKLGYNNQALLDLPQFSLEQNEHCLISGNSGCGKTTLLYTIAGLIKPICGEIYIDGYEISKLHENEMDKFRGQNIGIIFQNFHLLKSLTVLDNLLLSYYLAGVSQNKNAALEILDQLSIKDLTSKFPHQISQGQTQRVAIARAILMKPKLILADEPTSNLDDKNAESAINLIQKVADETSSTLIISTHDSRIKKHFKKIINFGDNK